ncbi:Flp pilus assembly protein TadG [Burkholderia sp. GAS332]|nr:Flp pilus assembly protein TadG [Burkholderia sp. GAS332]
MNPPRSMLKNLSSLRPALSRRARRLKQSGQSMAEFIIIAPALLFVGFATVQFVLLYQAKSTLDVAVLEAAREGAVNNGSMKAMRAGLARGLAPIYARHADADGVAAAQAKAQADAANFSIITVLNPTQQAVQVFSQPRVYLDPSNPVMEIPNDTLMYRDSSMQNPAKMSIQDANILKIHVHYCYNMYVPLANKVLYYAANVIGSIGRMGILTREPANLNKDPYGFPQNGDSLCKVKLVDGIATGRWPLSLDSEAMVRMQSPFRMASANDSPNPTGN